MSEALNREYHEKLGLVFWDMGPQYRNRVLIQKPHMRSEWADLPRLDLDANLCIAELDRVFQDWYVRLEHIDDPASEFHGKKTILVTGENFNREKDDWEPSCSGHSIGNFCEAALKCLIAAHKRESEATWPTTRLTKQ